MWITVQSVQIEKLPWTVSQISPEKCIKVFKINIELCVVLSNYYNYNLETIVIDKIINKIQTGLAN